MKKELYKSTTLTILPGGKKRVNLSICIGFINKEKTYLDIGYLHPKHAEDVLRVYNRSEESYDNVY